MQMVRVSVQLPKTLKAKIDALRERGTSASWFLSPTHSVDAHDFPNC